MSRARTFRETHLRAEHNCDKHTYGITLWYNNDPERRRPSIVAALLRTLAVYTDGFCADEGADDNGIDLGKQGLRLWFTSDANRKKFLSRTEMYLSRFVDERVTYETFDA